jgi:hypothetical protein
MWISHRTLNVNFYYQWYFSTINTSPTWKITLSLKNYLERYTQVECCYKFTIFAFFADSVMSQSYGFDGQLDTAHGKGHLVKMFKQLMISVKIILCLESHEKITELSVHTSTSTHTHTHTHKQHVNKIILCILCQILTYLKCELHKVLWKGILIYISQCMF